MLVDSHCHLDCLDLTPYNGDLSKAIDAAKEIGVQNFLCVNIDLDNFENVLAIAEQYPFIHASVGVHPNTELSAEDEPSVETLVKLSKNERIVAIGETGLDYFRTSEGMQWQQDRFRNHIRAGKETNKPLIIHTRDARDDTLAIMREEKIETVGAVMHCFTETWEMAEAAMDMNCYISFSGIVTFKNAKALQEVAKKVPLDRMLIETDSPYLAPVPFRGKKNEPKYVHYVAEFIANLRGESYKHIAKQTTENYFSLFFK